jgi:hypothetical protein
LSPEPITYLVTKEHSYTVEPFLEDWVPELKPRFNIVAYGDALSHSPPPLPGLVIFSDLDRLDPSQRKEATKLADHILLSGGRILNHPAHVIGRLDLLRRLEEAGLNHFSAFTLRDLALGRWPRFPLFLRTDSDHSGSLTPLIRRPGRLSYYLARQSLKAVLRRRSLPRILIVEFEDVADPETSLVRKYSYMRIGERMIPRHVFFGTNWVLKYADICSPDLVAEESEFLKAADTIEPIDAVFRLAGIDYGRIDFSIRPKDGAIQVWEINTNPLLVPWRKEVAPLRMAMQEEVTRRMGDALAAEAESTVL